jgi:pyruvate ferredoxin oxidoreductase alpha subunit
MVGPEAYTEVRYLAHLKQLRALDLIPRVAAEFKAMLGREAGGLIRPYRVEGAETIVVALGSVLGTIKDTVDELREAGHSIGVVGITTFRPFPLDATRYLLRDAKRVLVVEKCFAIGVGGIVATNVRLALRWHARSRSGTSSPVSVAAPSPRTASPVCFREGMADQLEAMTFLDLDNAVVDRVLERERQSAPFRPDRREHPARGRHGRFQDRLRGTPMSFQPVRQVLPDRHLHRR